MKFAVVVLILSLIALSLADKNPHQKSLQDAGHNGAARKQNNRSAPEKVLVKHRRANRNNADGKSNRYSTENTGYTTSEENGYSLPVDSGYTSPEDNGYALPADSGYTSPDADAGYASPENGYYSPVEETARAIEKAIRLIQKANSALQPLIKDALDFGRALLNSGSSSRKAGHSDVTSHINRLKRSANTATQKLVPVANEAIAEGLKLLKSWSSESFQ